MNDRDADQAPVGWKSWSWGARTVFVLVVGLLMAAMVAMVLWRHQLYHWLGDTLVLSGTVGQLVFMLGVNAVVVWRLWLARSSGNIGMGVRAFLTVLTIAVSSLYLWMLWS